MRSRKWDLNFKKSQKPKGLTWMKKAIPGQNSVPGIECDQPLEQVRLLQEDWAAIVLCQLQLAETMLPELPP